MILKRMADSDVTKQADLEMALSVTSLESGNLYL